MPRRLDRSPRKTAEIQAAYERLVREEDDWSPVNERPEAFMPKQVPPWVPGELPALPVSTPPVITPRTPGEDFIARIDEAMRAGGGGIGNPIDLESLLPTTAAPTTRTLEDYAREQQARENPGPLWYNQVGVNDYEPIVLQAGG